jgi:hypothetical protein
MTFGSASAIFTQAMKNPICRAVDATTAPTTFTSLTATDVVNAALFNDTTTPNKDAAVGSTGYNTGVWVTANEVIDTGGSNWIAKGRALASRTFTAGTSVVTYDAADTAGAGNVTIASAFGCLIFDDTISGGTIADQGMCYNAFGSSQGVTGGSFTIVWDATGIFKISV